MLLIPVNITSYLHDNGEQSITELANGLDQDRHVVSKRLQILEERGVVEHRQHGPTKLWSTTSSALVSKISKDDELAAELQHVLSELPGDVSAHDEYGRIAWSTAEQNGGRRTCHLYHTGEQEPCPGCPLEDVKEHGETTTFTTTWGDEEATITLIPINDNNENPEGVIEYIR